MTKIRMLDRRRDFGSAVGAARYSYTQDGLFFNQHDFQVTEDGEPVAAPPEPKGPAPQPSASTPSEDFRTPAPRQRRAVAVDPHHPYENDERPPLKALRERYAFLTRGKRFPLGTSIDEAKQMINEFKAEAAGMTKTTVGAPTTITVGKVAQE